MSIKFTKLSSITEESHIINEWDRLLEKANGHFYQDWRWLVPLKNNLLPDTDFIFAHDRTGLILVLPILFVKENKTLKLPYCKYTDIVDCLIDESIDVTTMSEALFDYLKKEYPDWVCLENERLLEGSHYWKLFSEINYKKHLDRYSTSNYFETENTSSLDSISKKHRKNVRRFLKKLNAKHGELDVSLHRSSKEDIQAFLALEDTSWKGASDNRSSILSDPSGALFYRQISENFSANGQLSICASYADDQLISGQLSIVNNGIQHLLKISYHPDYEEFSPGNLLLLKLLEANAETDKINRVSLVTGPTWSERWHPNKNGIHWGVIYNQSMSGKLAYSKRRLKEHLRPLKTRVLSGVST